MSSDAGTRDVESEDAAPADEARTLPGEVTASSLHEPTSGERYVILECLGAGGMGVVYVAWDRALARRVALKIVREGMDQGRFQREAQALAKLKHPNVVTVYDAGAHGRGLFIAMELVDGNSMLRWLQERPRRWREILAAFIAAGRGLAAAHDASLVHRDFKPENVLIGADHVARVVDFGLALALDEPVPPVAESLSVSSERLTQTGTVLGTPRYMAPEQHQGGTADPRSDQYSFCVALLEALTGVHPVTGDPAPATGVGQPPARIVAILRRGLETVSAERWPSMKALLAELERTSPKRIWIAAGIAALALAAGIVVQRRAGDSAVAACRVEGDAWSEVSGEPDSIHAAFVATGAPGAGPAADGAIALLRRYAGEHGGMTRSSCEATRVKGTQSTQAYAARAECLRRHRQTLRALASELAHPDAAMVRRAVEAAQALPPVSDCADGDTLDVRIPREERLRPAAATLRAELDQLEVLDAAGRLRVVLVRAQAAVALARLVGFPPLVADALVRLGTTYNRLDDFVRARDLLEEGVFVAQAAGYDGALVRASILLSRLSWYVDRKMVDARRWARLATATIARLGPGGESLLLEARLELRLSDLERVDGRYRLAEEHARKALAVYERVQPNSRGVHVARVSLAGALESQGRLAESEAVYRDALAGAAQLMLGGDDVSRILAGLAIVAGSQGHLAEARQLYLQAIERATEVTGPSSTVVAGYVNNLATVDERAGRPAEALEGYRRARKMATERLGAGSSQLSGYLRNEGHALAQLGRQDEARASLEEAVALAQKEAPSGLELADALLQLAGLHLDQGDRAAAEPLARRALAMTEAVDRESVETADALATLAVATEDSGAASLPLFRRALPLIERWHGVASPEAVRLRGEMGVALRRAGDRDAARATLEGALAMAPHKLPPRALATLAALLDAAGDHERAARLLDQAHEGYLKHGDARGAAEAARVRRPTAGPR